MLIFVSCIAVGIVLGFRFRVLVLLPAFILGWSVIVGVGVIAAWSISAIAIEAILATFGLQIGYLIGAAMRSRFLAFRRLQSARILDFSFVLRPRAF